MLSSFFEGVCPKYIAFPVLFLSQKFCRFHIKKYSSVILRQFVILGDTASIVGQQNLFNYNEFARIDYNALRCATIVVSIIPILLLYPLVLRYYAKDVMAGGVKE